MIVFPDGELSYTVPVKRDGYFLYVHDQHDFGYGNIAHIDMGRVCMSNSGDIRPIPRDEAITRILDALNAAWSKDVHTLRNLLDSNSVVRIIYYGWQLDMVHPFPPWTADVKVGPKTIEFLERVIKYWAPIDNRIADKAKEVLARYLTEQL